METLVTAMPTASYAIALAAAFTFGACIGSFINVVAYRVPKKVSLIYPPSRCPHCRHPLGVTENVPLFGWLWLKGRCRWCKTKISSRYPIVEFITGATFVLVFWRFGYSIETIGYCVLLSWLLSLSLIDLDTMTLPACLTKSGLVLGLIFQSAVGWQIDPGTAIAHRLMFGISGAVLGIWLLEIIAVIGLMILGQQAMGDGDGKLMATMGAWIGWKYVLLSGFIACGIGSIVGGGAIALGGIGKKQPIPFGPCLAVGGVVSLFLGDAIIDAYLNTFLNY